MTTITKDPSAVLDYAVDWSRWLSGDSGSPADTIATSIWSIPEGLTKTDEEFAATSATVWLSGGSAGTVYRVTNRITTAAGRTDERSFKVSVTER